MEGFLVFDGFGVSFLDDIDLADELFCLWDEGLFLETDLSLFSRMLSRLVLDLVLLFSLLMLLLEMLLEVYLTLSWWFVPDSAMLFWSYEGFLIPDLSLGRREPFTEWFREWSILSDGGLKYCSEGFRLTPPSSLCTDFFFISERCYFCLSCGLLDD